MRHPLKCRGGTAAVALCIALLGAGAAVPARADEVKPIDAPGELAADPSFGLDPATPQVAALPGGVTPSYGQRSLSEEEWRFDFHGLVTAPLNMGFNHRATVGPGQSSLVLHAPPIVPDDLETFSHTGVTPTTYAQMLFTEANSIVSANMSIIARQANVSTDSSSRPSQLGITDVYLSLLPPLPNKKAHLQVLAGAFTSRYGSPGEYDEGRYGTPLIAHINGVGELVTLRYARSATGCFIGRGGACTARPTRPTPAITPDVWNNFADPGTGSTFVAHAHLGASYARKLTLGAHFIRAFSHDDPHGPSAPDGRIDIFAGDVRLGLGRFGHFYARALVHERAAGAHAEPRHLRAQHPGGTGADARTTSGRTAAGTGTLDTVGVPVRPQHRQAGQLPGAVLGRRSGPVRQRVRHVHPRHQRPIRARSTSSSPITDDHCLERHDKLKSGVAGDLQPPLLAGRLAPLRLCRPRSPRQSATRFSGASRRGSSSAPTGRRPIRSSCSTRTGSTVNTPGRAPAIRRAMLRPARRSPTRNVVSISASMWW